MDNGIIIRVSGVQVPPPLPVNLNEIDQIYQSHLIYGGFRIRYMIFICQSVCDQCVTVEILRLSPKWLLSIQRSNHPRP